MIIIIVVMIIVTIVTIMITITMMIVVMQHGYLPCNRAEALILTIPTTPLATHA